MANGPFLLAFVVASIAAVAIGLVLQRLIRTAAARHAILLAALLLPPLLLIAGLAGLRLPMPTAVPPGIADVRLVPAAAELLPREESVIPELLLALWLAGVMISLTRIPLDLLRWKRVARRAEVIDDPVILSRFESPCTLARSKEVCEPTVIGIVDPIVVLPASYELAPAELDAVFAHEIAHVDRRDNLTALAVQLVCAAFWFDPLHRVARRKLVELRERVCDGLVIEQGCDAEAYARALARSCANSFSTPAVACMSRLNLHERMESIMTHENRRRWPSWLTRGFVTAAVVAAALSFGTFAPAVSLTAGESGTPYDFHVDVISHGGGRYMLGIRIDTPEGPFTSLAMVPSAPDTRSVTTTQGGKTYKVTVNVAADGSATGTLDVSEGSVPLASNTKSFAVPVTKPTSVSDKYTTPPKILHRVEPGYTPEARDARVAGVCILAIDIDETGAVTATQVLKPLPMGLSEAAVAAVKQWQFSPALKDGKPVAVTYNITINFRLDS